MCKKLAGPKERGGCTGFLGLTSYYRKFIQGYGKIAKPLTDLTNKEGFKWNEEAKQTFEALKEAVTSTPVVALPDFSKVFEVECDASRRGLGAVLMQSRRPIAYLSKALSPSNLAKSIYEKELMAVALAIKHWSHYLCGRRFLVYFDKKSLKHLMQQPIVSADQQNWLARLLGFNFEVIYKPGLENKAVT